MAATRGLSRPGKGHGYEHGYEWAWGIPWSGASIEWTERVGRDATFGTE